VTLIVVLLCIDCVYYKGMSLPLFIICYFVYLNNTCSAVLFTTEFASWFAAPKVVFLTTCLYMPSPLYKEICLFTVRHSMVAIYRIQMNIN
jgi:hypothetical protein